MVLAIVTTPCGFHPHRVVASTTESQGALNSERHPLPSAIPFNGFLPGRGNAPGFDCTFPATIILER